MKPEKVYCWEQEQDGSFAVYARLEDGTAAHIVSAKGEEGEEGETSVAINPTMAHWAKWCCMEIGSMEDGESIPESLVREAEKLLNSCKKQYPVAGNEQDTVAMSRKMHAEGIE